ncbi:MAG: DUF4912 domain-containing protein [Candidatus Omnitrophica bacterium]|nr:DUF4912 domain-containing protein [Candidatus Omnitrophota bacterium]
MKLIFQPSKKDRSFIINQELLRKIAWDTGTHFPLDLNGNLVTLSMSHPSSGFMHWKLQKESVDSLHDLYKERFNHSRLVLRVYDVTDVSFDGFNAHHFFDIDIQGLSGQYYLHIGHPGRNLLTEVGFRLQDGHFHSMARSICVAFANNRPSNNYSINGYYVRSAYDHPLPVENIFNAGVFKRMHRELRNIKRTQTRSLFLVSFKAKQQPELNAVINNDLQNFAHILKTFGIKTKLFIPQREVNMSDMCSTIQDIYNLSRDAFQQLVIANKKKPISFVHCYNWLTAGVGIRAVDVLNIPMILSLNASKIDTQNITWSKELREYAKHCEKNATHKARIIIVPDEKTRECVIEKYSTDPDKVVIVPLPTTEVANADNDNPKEIRRAFALDPHAKIGLFAGELSHSSGIDLLINSLSRVDCHGHNAHFIFAGHGPLKDEMNRRCRDMGLGNRCHFWGDVDHSTFEKLLEACDYVMIPARTHQGDELARMAIQYGKPVLTTHQAHIHSIKHGENGLVAYDNLNSISWAVNEMLSHPVQGGMLRLVAQKKHENDHSLESIVVKHYITYEKAFHKQTDNIPKNKRPERYYARKLNAVALSEDIL